MASKTNKKPSTFLLKTYQMLEKHEYRQIVHWNEEQNGFVITNQELFASDVLPAYFKHNNMHSFVRQLNMYGFSKKRAKNQNYYHHPQFLRGRLQLIPQIQRKEEKKVPKNARQSTVSIENQLPPHDPYQTLLQMNYCLLLEQAANLKLILDELEESPSKKSLEQISHEYISIHSQIIQKVKASKADSNRTAQSLYERSQEC